MSLVVIIYVQWAQLTNLLQTNRKLLGRVLATRTGQSVTVIGKFALKSTKHNILNIIRIG